MIKLNNFCYVVMEYSGNTTILFCKQPTLFSSFHQNFQSTNWLFFCKIRTMTRHFENHQNQLYLQFLFSKKRLSLELK